MNAAVASFGVKEKVFSSFVCNSFAVAFWGFTILCDVSDFSTIITFSSFDIKNIEGIFIVCQRNCDGSLFIASFVVLVVMVTMVVISDGLWGGPFFCELVYKVH